MSSVVLVIFMLVIILCSVGYDSLWIWWIVMLHPVLMLISCLCIIASCYFIMAQHIAFKFNRIKLNLNNCWLSHGATISKLTSATTLTFMGRS